MQEVTISTKFQIVIPKLYRKNLGLVPGQKLQMIEYDGRLELVPVCEIHQLRGFVKGIDTSFHREEDRL